MSNAMNEGEKRLDDPLAEVFAKCKEAFVAAGIFSFVVNIMVLVMPMYMFSLFDRVLGTGNMATLAALAVIAFTALFIQALVDIARTYLFVQVTGWFDRQIGDKLFDLSVNGSLSRGAMGSDALNRLASLRSFLGSPAVYNLMDAPFLPIFIIVMFMFNFAIGMTALIGGGILLALAVANKLYADPKLLKATAANGRARKVSGAAMNNADVVESMGMRPHFKRNWRAYNDISLDIQAEASRTSGVIQAFVKMLRMGIMMAVMTVSVVEILDPLSGMSRGAMMASVILVGRALMPLEVIVSGWSQVVGAREDYEAVAYMLRHGFSKQESSVYPLEVDGHLAVVGVGYQPRGAPVILNRINFRSEPGEVLAIVGPSAAGKSSLARLLVGIEKPTTGAVRLDGADVSAWPSADLGRYVGYLPQGVELFEGTVRDNIARFDPDVTNEQVIAAAKMTDLHSMILRFPQGYDTPIGPGGVLLSGGQRQRVGLARAVIGNVKLVILDEPNSNLDSTGEDALIATITELRSRGVNVIVILHRPNILQVVDKVLVLHGGQVQRFGPRDEIMPQLGLGKNAELEKTAPKVIANQAGE